MPVPERPNIVLVREYLAALESGEAGDSFRRFFSEDARQIELPNVLNRDGQESTVDQLIERSVAGQKLLSAQRFEILSTIAGHDSVAVEALWTGKLV